MGRERPAARIDRRLLMADPTNSVLPSNLTCLSNQRYGKVESIVTVKQLKQRYLFGVSAVDAQGNELPDAAYQNYINNSIGLLETDLGIFIAPQNITEQKDYEVNDYFQWGYLQLNYSPVICLTKLSIAYLRDVDPLTGYLRDNAVLEIPREWIRLSGEEGNILRLVPNNKFPANLQVGAGGSFFPELFRRQGHVPDLWLVEYEAGFKDGKVPVLINHAIGLLASIQAYSIAGNLVLGAGIAGTSLSLDGLSQSIQTTQSAENSAYSATRKEYADLLFGKRVSDPNSIITILRNKYRGTGINII